MKEYVLGFAFDEKSTNVVLIEKLRPKWQKGLYNAIGGKVEDFDKFPVDAMIREFNEETSVDLFPNIWNHFATMIFENDIMGGSAKIYCFKIFSDEIFQCKTTEDEEIRIYNISDLDKIKTTPNLKMLAYLALCENVEFIELKMK